MADGYNIKIGVDARAGEQGVRQFTGSVNDALKALRDFDKKAGNAFKALDQFTKFSGAGLNRSLGQVAAGIERLNKIKINTRVINNLQSLSRALSGLRFTGAESLRTLPGALKELDKLKINQKLAQDLTTLKAALKGFNSPSNAIKAWPKALGGFANVVINSSLAKTIEGLKTALKGFGGPPKSMSAWPRMLTALGSVSINASLPKSLAALKVAMAGFTGPSKSALNLPKFLQQLSTAKLSPTMAKQVESLKLALSGFSGPSASAAKNLNSLIAAMGAANVGQVQKVAAALARLNGLSINVGRSLGSMGKGGASSMSAFQRTIDATNRSMQQLTNMSHGVQSLLSMLSGVLGGISMVGFAKGIYETSTAWQALTRTLAAVSTSNDEVQQQLKFIQDLTTRMPISIEAAADSYRKFAAAARLSGMSVEKTQKIFGDFAVGFSAMGVSVENQKYAFVALEQMISKGSITSEELKQQLGEHLPGAVQIFADALGVPTQKLLKMMEAGELTADVLDKAGDSIAKKFGGAAEIATRQTAGQMQAMANAWTNFQKIIANSGFDAALGALAGKIATILNSDEAKKFAEDLGGMFKRLFEAASVVIDFLATNKDMVLTFMKGFAGYALIVASAGALRLFSAPLMIMAPLLGVVTSGLGLMGSAFMALATGKAAKSVADMTKLLSGMSGKMMAIAGTAVLLAVAMDSLFNNGDARKSLMNGLQNMFDYLGERLSSFGNSMSDSLTGVYDNASKAQSDFLKRTEDIGKANVESGQVNQENAKRQLELDKERLKALSPEAQKLWDKVTAVGMANDAYQKQLKLISEIVKKKNLSPEMEEGFRRVMLAQKDEKLDPIGYSADKMREQLGGLKALTTEQKALNEAKAWENDMLNKNVIATAAQWAKAKQAVVDYQLAVAKMNGEAGNGIERFSAKVGDFMDNFHKTVSSTIDDFSSSLADALTGGEADFASMARSALKSFAKISIDGILKDVAGAMGMDGQKNGQSAADKALADLSAIGKVIQAQQVELYAGTVNVNTAPTIPNAMAAPVGAVDKSALPDIPGYSNKDGIKLDLNKVYGTKESEVIKPGAAVPQPAASAALLKASIDPSSIDTMNMASLGGNNEAMTSAVLKERLTKDFNLKGFQAAGIVGNLAHESNGYTANNEIGRPDGGFGLAQWTGSRRKDFMDFAAKQKKDPTQFGTQYEFLKQELNGSEAYSMNKLRDTTTVEGATRSFQDNFERPGVPHFESRLEYANKALNNGAASQLPSTMPVQPTLDAPVGGADIRKMDGLNWDGRMIKDVKGLTFHHTGGRGNAQGVNDVLNKRGLGAQYIMERDGTIFQNGPDGARMAHMKPAQNGSGLSNENALGIEMIAKDNNDLTEAQKLSGLKFIQDMKAKYPGIGENVYGHGELNAHKQKTEGMGVVDLYRRQRDQLGQQPAVDMMPTGSIPQVDPMAAANVNQLNTALQQTGAVAQQAAAPMTQMNTAVQQLPATAATADAGLGQFGQGISKLLGPLASAIPGVGQFGNAIMSMLGSLGGGGGAVGLFSEGGMSTSPVQTMKVPHFAEGTANTSGGMPAVLHPNEAVIPLSRGRQVPVEINGGASSKEDSRQEKLDKGRPTMVINLNGVKDADSFKRSKSQITSSLASAQQRAALRDG